MDPVLPTWPIDEDIYTGFWMNRSLGKFRAATITLDQRMWNFLIAFVALFVAATARSIWKLIRFVIHHNLSTSLGRDGVYHQRQAVLRNTVLATDAAIQFVEISHVWRHRGDRARALLLCTVAFMVSGLTTAAGFFSSELLERSPSEVLITGRNCGDLPLGYPPNKRAWASTVMNYNSEKAWADFLYAGRCYGNKTAIGCDNFVQPALPYTSDRNAPCPFAPEMCKLKHGNLLLDTGELDSIKQLGLNRGPRFTLRYRTHCAPLVTKNYTTVVPQVDYTYRNFTRYDYGMIYKPANGQPDPWIYWIEQDDKSKSKPLIPGGTYGITYKDHYWVDFIPQLTNLEALVSLVFLDSSAVTYLYKTDDPWFSATTNSSISEHRYVSDEPVGVLGCSTQRFLCNPDLPGSECVNSYTRKKSILAIQRAWPNPQDQHKIYPLLASNYQYGLPIGKGGSESLYSISGAPTLLARKTMRENVQTAQLPSNQWQLEREHIFAATIAAWQSSLVAYARGSWYGHSSCNENFICERVCHSQRIRSSAFHSFSAWTLLIVLCLGVTIMVVAFFLEELWEYLLHRTYLRTNQRLRHAFAEWQAGSTLQLQRIAHENLGLGTWKRTDESVPVTRKNEILGVFDTTDRKHARLVKPSAEMKDPGVDDEVLPVNTRARIHYSRLASSDYASSW